tara:strand:+ start:5397 stop:5921 length:525 start_codon:yes stop_codon:yes gene_type:complete
MKEFFFFLIFVLLITNINPIAYANKNNTSWASLKYNKTYLRTGPSKNNKVIWVYKRKGLPFKILRQKNEWSEVLLPSSQKGWINSSQISKKRNVLIQNTRSSVELALSNQKEIIVTDKNLKTLAYVKEGVIAALISCMEELCKIELKVKKDKYFFKNSYKLSGYIRRDFLWGVD